MHVPTHTFNDIAIYKYNLHLYANCEPDDTLMSVVCRCDDIHTFFDCHCPK